MGKHDYSCLTSTSAIALNRAASISQIMALAYVGITPHILELHRVGPIEFRQFTRYLCKNWFVKIP